MIAASGKILGISEKASYFFGGLSANSWPSIVIDIILVTILFYFAYLFVRETKAIRILYGLLILVALMLAGQLLNLVLLNWILKYLMTMLIVAIPIVFQPELRNALEKLGRSKFITDFAGNKKSDGSPAEELLSAIDTLSRKKIGALIVIAKKTGLREYIERGIEIEAKVKSDLLLSMFYPKSPLHDGAVIISGSRIVAASVTLPVSDAEDSGNLGMRHRAGLGISESSDAVAIIVSEETGSVSIAYNGNLERRLGEDRLRARLNYLMRK